MDTKSAFRIVESERFAIEANLAGGFRMFLDGIERSDACVTLRDGLSSRAGEEKIGRRLYALVRGESGAGSGDKGDVAAAVYLWILRGTESSIVRRARILAKEKRDFWWARMLAEWLEERAAGAWDGEYEARGGNPNSGCFATTQACQVSEEWGFMFPNEFEEHSQEYADIECAATSGACSSVAVVMEARAVTYPDTRDPQVCEVREEMAT